MKRSGDAGAGNPGTVTVARAAVMVRRLSSLRVRLVLLVVGAFVPAAVVIFISAQDRRNDGAEHVRSQALSLASLTAVQYNEAVQSTRAFLLPLAQLFAAVPDLRAVTGQACQPFFAKLIANDSRLVVVAVALPDGTVQCSNQPSTGSRVSVADEAFFKLASETRDFALGSVTTDSVTGRTAIHAGYPILAADGSVHGVMYAGLNVTALSEAVVRTGLPEGSFASIVDRTDTILARYPEPERWVGQPVASQPGFVEVQSHPAGLTVEGRSIEGTAVVIGSVGLSSLGGAGGEPSDAFVSVGIPTSTAYASVDRRLRMDLLWLLAVALVAAGAAWFGSGLVLGGLRRYVRAAGSIAEGNFSMRTGPPYPSNELGDLGRAFDEMAAGIERRDSEIRALNEGLERRVTERTAELEVVNRDLESFSYSVSHDLRAPLRSIDGFSQALLEDYVDTLDEQGKDYLQRVRASAQGMGYLIDDLLALSRVTRSEMRRETVSLSALAEAVMDEVRRAEPQRRVEVAIQPGLQAVGDLQLLRIVLANLLSNAWKFTGRQPQPRIEFGAMRNADGAPTYFVRDNGVGFDMAYADKLFGPFQRLHSLSEFPGTGIGLATVQRIVHRHGGQVGAEGVPGQGATFSFTLPA